MTVETRSYSEYLRICRQYHYNPMSYTEWAVWSITPLPDVSHIFAPRWILPHNRIGYDASVTTVTRVPERPSVATIARQVAIRSKELLARLASR